MVLAGRYFIPQSGHWLLIKGRIDEAEKQTQALLRREPAYPKTIRLNRSPIEHPEPALVPRAGFRALFSKEHRRATILASVPWFLQDIATYGIGIFTPTILASTIGVTDKHARNLAEVIHNDILGARGAALIDVLLIAGILAAVFLVDRVGRIPLQIIGFIGCAAGLLLASVSVYFSDDGRVLLLFAGFMLFNFMTNLGPNAMTYLLAGEVFPMHIRGMGAGFAAAFAKLGAVATSFLFPILLVDLGTSAVLTILIGASLLGALVTWRLGIETTGVNLETIGRDKKDGR